MQNEEISNKTISITTRSAEKVLRFLAKKGFKGLKIILQTGKRKLLEEGKQSYKRLHKSGQGLSAVDIRSSDDVKLFKDVAKEYRLDFALKKDMDTGMYVLFFKAKDKEVYDKVFAKYADRLEEIGKKKSIVKELASKKAEAEKTNKERAADMVKKIYAEHERT